jgi:hypothetical protein
MKLLRISLYAALCVWASTVWPFEVNTHRQLSTEAVRQSTLTQKLADFGLKNTEQSIVVNDTDTINERVVVCVPTMTTTLASAMDLIRLGSLCEDAAYDTTQSLRFLNHFFDPQHAGQGLDYLGRHTDSLTWARDPQGVLTSQQYSVLRAKEYLLASLTRADSLERQKSLGLLFRTLGHVMHLVQDLGQPQHTRNDSHGSGSGFEIFVDDKNKAGALTYSGYSAVPVTVIDDLWHTQGLTGLADYSSTGFVTAGTNFRGIVGMTSIDHASNYPLPDPVGAQVVSRQITDPDLLGAFSAAQPLRGEIRFLGTFVSDKYTGKTDWNPMTSSYSLFSDDLSHYVGYTHFSLNKLNYREAAKLLIPRAIGYSSGFLNYFFRGSMAIAPPDEGIFAVINHSPGDPAPGGCGTQCGFRKIKLKIKNTTSGEAMGGGKLLLVAKYHLNNCYQADLSGEIGGPAYTGNSCRSAEESIALSDPLVVSQVKGDFSDPALSFTFAAPLPINATDLRLQVVFQGQLGKENDAIAFSTVDIKEPSFLIFANHNDYINLYNPDGSYLRTDPYQAAGRFSVRVDLRFNQSAQSPIAMSAQLDPGYYHRLAILTDQEFLPYWIVEQYIGAQADTQEFTLAASENQTDIDDQVFNFPTYVQLRRTTPTGWAYESDDDGGAIYWIPGTSCVDGTTRCVPEDKEVGAIARRYPPFKQATPLPMTINF